ncbi:inositol-3-phosphate synthase [Actinacidiphila paucisporea]|uniref:Myo-inositol-1-phosphate synthase n=1 Tax=Actinacidiphila paucisporea TaxID=310782 RepID=A0A1M7PM42_9ACTN|nr:inositol-3-phosphate synthase [Actinacidiphila paucisporea]SHN18365.1 myo-inositol-1-phosphate synthase [Actinacidiphila paucisporea]
MRAGIWLIGARGSVATTSVVGALALRAGLTEPVGCVTAHPELNSAALPGFGDLFFGGHDVATGPLVKKAEQLAAAGVLPARLVQALAADLDAVDADLRHAPEGATQDLTAAAIARDLTEFRTRHRLDRVVVVNVASTEAAAPPHPAHAELAALTAALDAPGSVLQPSSLYAYAAFTADCPYVDFTPSTGARLPALAELAAQRGLPYAGHDGKTGETLLKSVLAPMFAMRNLAVRSWSGVNLLGGGDGASLVDPGANAAKSASKQRVLRETLGYAPDGDTRIDYVANIGDFKTAWDLITFEGFLGTGMCLQFTWQGCDSALAAPLVLDLARITLAAQEAGRSGPLEALAYFFKDPMGDVDHALHAQWDALRRYLAGLGEAVAAVDAGPGGAAVDAGPGGGAGAGSGGA